MSDDLFGPMFDGGPVAAATDGDAWLRAMLRVEVGIARAGAAAGLIPARAAAAIESACDPARFVVADIGRRAVGSASPVVPLVVDLRAAVDESARRYVHLGATSQDVLDTAMVLVIRDAAALVDADLRAVADVLAALAESHRHTVQMGRTLLQPAVPTTFGAVCAGWLVAVYQAREAFRTALSRLGLQYGGPVGTQDQLGIDGMRLAELLAADLGLPLPPLPWHTRRGPVAGLAAALGEVTGALGTVGLAVTLLAQAEIGELAEGQPGGSSAMPHKRNPAYAVLVCACAHRVPGLVATIIAGQTQELQRATGRWQAEWSTVTDLVRLTGAAAAHARTLVVGLRVDAVRMRANVGDADVRTAGVDALIDRALHAHDSAAGDLTSGPGLPTG